MCRCSSKTGLVIFNGIFLLVSLVLIILGTVVHESILDNPSLINKHVSPPASVALVLGTVMFFIASFAHVGVFCQQHKMLLAYAFFLFVLIFVELSVGILAFVTLPRILKHINNSLLSAEPEYASDSLAYDTWNALQRNFGCCGVNNYTEWLDFLGNSTLPDSCCANYTIGCGRDAVPTENFHQIDCNLAINEWVYKHEITAAIVFPVLICLKIITLFLSYSHIKSLRKKTYAVIT